MTSRSAVPAQPDAGTLHHFDFRFDLNVRVLLAVLGVTPSTSGVDVGPDTVWIRYGPWQMTLDRRNIKDVSVSGPYSAWRAIGPRLSLADLGVTFGTTTKAGVCLALREPVPALVPGRLLTHPGVTLTVDRPDELASLLKAAQ